MATVHIDLIRDLSCKERHGSIVELRRMAIVEGLPANTDYQVLFDALDNVGISAQSTLTGNNNLVLTERNPTMLSKDQAQVELVYEHFRNDGQSINSPQFSGLAVATSKSSLRTMTMSRYPEDYGTESLRGKVITVKHTFPDGSGSYTDENGNTLKEDNDYPGQEVVQGVSVDVSVPGEIITLQGLLATNRPRHIQFQYSGRINSAEWAGRAAGEWKCTRAEWDGYDLSSTPTRHKFTFEFEYNPEGWKVEAVFVDTRTGRPPPGLVDGDGIVELDYPLEADFNKLLRLT